MIEMGRAKIGSIIRENGDEEYNTRAYKSPR